MEEYLKVMVGETMTVYTSPQFAVVGKINKVISGLLFLNSWVIVIDSITMVTSETRQQHGRQHNPS